MLLIGEARHVIIGLRIQMRGLQAVFGENAKQRQRAFIPRSGRERPGQLMHEGGDEDGLARAGKSRDPETQPAAGKIVFEALGGDAGFEPKIGELRHGHSVQ